MTTKERPIIFSGDMVRAILDGRKTQTRRVVKIARHPQAERVQHFEGLRWDWLRYDGLRLATFKCPYGKEGDRLWVREKFSRHMIPEGEPYFYPADRLRECVDHDNGFHYWADGEPEYGDWERPKPSIHMPRLASRITLEIADVRAKRLQDISEEDAEAEGAEKRLCGGYPYHNPPSTFVNGFCHLWESINGPGSWDANPWVWCISFKRVTP